MFAAMAAHSKNLLHFKVQILFLHSFFAATDAENTNYVLGIHSNKLHSFDQCNQ